MKKILISTLSVVICIALAVGGTILIRAINAPPSETNSFVADYYLSPIDQDAPFFDVVLPEIEENIEEYNTHSINRYYDALPKANNPENFQGLGSTAYADINGKTVTAEAFYRLKGESLSDPNCGMGLLIYQCIQYKRAHPDEDVKISFSSYRTSATAAVCVLPESKYYGYMRSLFGTNYDEHGFVRISYMLTEAARMGIEVKLVNQLTSYGVSQYKASTGKTAYREALDYTIYFNQALESDCYDKYAKGKKVSDFMTFIKVGWTVEDQTTNMQHLKSCTVSHYLATDGSEHRSGVFFTTSNLDENNYKGCNGNGYSQTGVIISDHDELYRVTLNYTDLMIKYSYTEGLQELRKHMIDMNIEQTALIKAGRESEIPRDEQIVYLGTENDSVFELYFTPLGNNVDTWDAEYNPICNYVDKMVQSDNYIEFVWNEYSYEAPSFLGKTIGNKIEQAFCNNPNPNNKISVQVEALDVAQINNLQLGKEIGYYNLSVGKNTSIHAKDFLISYSEDGTRHNVSILTSCNLVLVGFHHRTNSILVINETEESGGNFYEILGDKYSNGMITAD